MILVNIRAAWCPPCQDGMPDLQAFHASHAKAGVFVIAIESGEPANQVVSFVQNYGLTFPIWLDPQSLALEVVNYFNFPSSYVIDKSGKVRLSSTGEVNLPILDKYITRFWRKK